MKLHYIFFAIFIFFAQNTLASDLLIKIKKMSKSEYLNTMPKAMNDFIVNSGGKVQAGAGMSMTGVQRIGDMIVIMFEMEYNSLKRAIRNKRDMSNEDIKDFVGSDNFKQNMFGKDGAEKKFMINHSCSEPTKLEALKKGVIIKYMYMLDTGEHLGAVNISIDSCK